MRFFSMSVSIWIAGPRTSNEGRPYGKRHHVQQDGHVIPSSRSLISTFQRSLQEKNSGGIDSCSWVSLADQTGWWHDVQEDTEDGRK